MKNKFDDVFDDDAGVFDDDVDDVMFENYYIRYVINDSILKKIRTAPLPTVPNLNICKKSLLCCTIDVNKKFYDVTIMTGHTLEPTNPNIKKCLLELNRIALIHTEKYDILYSLALSKSDVYNATNSSNFGSYLFLLGPINILLNVNLKIITDSKIYFKIIKFWYRSYFYILNNYDQITPKTLKQFTEIWYFNLGLFILLHNMIDILISKKTYDGIFGKNDDNVFSHINFPKLGKAFNKVRGIRWPVGIYSDLANMISDAIRSLKPAIGINDINHFEGFDHNAKNINNIDYSTLRNIFKHLEALILLNVNLEKEFILKNNDKN